MHAVGGTCKNRGTAFGISLGWRILVKVWMIGKITCHIVLMVILIQRAMVDAEEVLGATRESEAAKEKLDAATENVGFTFRNLRERI